MDYCSELKREEFSNVKLLLLFTIFFNRKEVNVNFVNYHFISLLMPSPLTTPSLPQNNLLATNPFFFSKKKKCLFLHV